jgi:hypothetical protein
LALIVGLDQFSRHVLWCSPLSKAGAELALLGTREKPEDGGEALSDTSGGVSVGAMVGMAGSFSLVVRLVQSG